MNSILTTISIIIISYALGCLTGAYYIVRYMMKKDIRQLGSSNVGATNVARYLGQHGFLATIVIDSAKVAIAIAVTASIIDNEKYFMLSALCVMLGHLFPVQLRFHGGKGVVVYLATALIVSPITIAVMAIVMGILYASSRKYKMAGVISMATIPLSSLFFEKDPIITVGLLLLLIIVVLAHFKQPSFNPKT